MVLTLGLVGIGAFGACLSALLCILAQGTSCEIPGVVSFKESLSRSTRIIRSVDRTKWKIPLPSEEGEIVSSVSQSVLKTRLDCRKRCWQIRKNLGHDTNNFVQNFDPCERKNVNDLAKCEEPYKNEWTKVRIKKRRFILPKNLVIDTRMKNKDVTNREISGTKFSSESAEFRFHGRHCYLEALRAKAVNNYINRKRT